MKKYPGCTSNCQSTDSYGSCQCYTGMEDWSVLTYLKFEEGAGSTTYNYGSYGSLNYTVAGGNWTTSGKYGKAYMFNGNGGYIETTSLKYANFKDNFTMMAWVKPGDSIYLPNQVSSSSSNNNVAGQTPHHFLFGAVPGHQTDPNRSNNWAGAGVSVGTNGVFVTAHTDNFFARLAYSNQSLNDSNWHHIAVVFTNRIPRIYIDGADKTKETISSAPDKTIFPSNQIGGGLSTYGNFKGSVDEVKIFGRALSATEIAQHFDAYAGCDTRSRKCIVPENAALWNPANDIVEQTYVNGEWTPSNEGPYSAASSSTPCAFKCLTGSYNETAKKCATTKTSDCTGKPDHAHWNTVSSIEQEWNGYEWNPKDVGSYNPEASSTECRFVCDTGYVYDYDYGATEKTCIKQRTAECTGKVDHSTWWHETITQNWTLADGWQPTTEGTYSDTDIAGECHFHCNSNYNWDGSQCKPKTRPMNCSDLALLPAGAEWWNENITQTWNGSTWKPDAVSYSQAPVANYCYFKCAAEHHWEDNLCQFNTKTSPCTGLPTAAHWNTATSITQNWNGSAWEPETAVGSYNTEASSTECRYKCSDDHLVYLKLNETTNNTSTVNSGSLGGSYGTTYNSSGQGEKPDSSGKYNGCYYFVNNANTSNSYNVRYPITADNLIPQNYRDNFTMMAWVKPTQTSSITKFTQSDEGTGATGSSATRLKYIFGAIRGEGSDPYQYSGDAGIGVSVGTDGIVVAAHAASYMPPLAKYQTTLDKNTWHHVAVVIKDKTPYIYLNGTLVHTGLQAKKEHVFISNSIGGGPYGAFTGYLDEVRLIGKDLTESEIQDLMNRNDCYNR